MQWSNIIHITILCLLFAKSKARQNNPNLYNRSTDYSCVAINRRHIVCLVAGCLTGTTPVAAGPLVCSNYLKPSSGVNASTRYEEISVCERIESVPEAFEKRFFGWTSPYARGVDVVHQITDFFGIAMGGVDGNRLMGFGFPDQTIVWDGSSLENTMNYLMDTQIQQLPQRTTDLINAFESSLALEQEKQIGQEVEYVQPIRPLW